jgi:hypothetical protein
VGHDFLTHRNLAFTRENSMKPLQYNPVAGSDDEPAADQLADAQKARGKRSRRRVVAQRRAVPAAFSGIHRRRKKRMAW